MYVEEGVKDPSFVEQDVNCQEETCLILEPNAPTEYLGTMVSAPVEMAQSLTKALEKTSQKRRKIEKLDHAVTEVILNRRLADVATVNYWLRCHGDTVTEATV